MKKILLILVVLLNIFLVGCSDFENTSGHLSTFEYDFFYKINEKKLNDNSVALCFGYLTCIEKIDQICLDLAIKVFVDEETNPVEVIEISNEDIYSMIYNKLVDYPKRISDYSNPFYFNVLDYNIKKSIKIELSFDRRYLIGSQEVDKREVFYLYLEGEIIENEIIVSDYFAT